MVNIIFICSQMFRNRYRWLNGTQLIPEQVHDESKHKVGKPKKNQRDKAHYRPDDWLVLVFDESSR